MFDAQTQKNRAYQCKSGSSPLSVQATKPGQPLAVADGTECSTKRGGGVVLEKRWRVCTSVMAMQVPFNQTPWLVARGLIEAPAVGAVRSTIRGCYLRLAPLATTCVPSRSRVHAFRHLSLVAGWTIPGLDTPLGEPVPLQNRMESDQNGMSSSISLNPLPCGAGAGRCGCAGRCCC